MSLRDTSCKQDIKMFRFIFKKTFFAGITVLSILIGANSLSCISMTNK